jgi:hypothetical protein
MSLAEDAYAHAQKVSAERELEFNRRNYPGKSKGPEGQTEGGALPRAVRYAMEVQHLNERKNRSNPGFVEPVPFVNPLASVLRTLEAIAGDISVGASASTLELARQLLSQLETTPLTTAQMYELSGRIEQLIAPLAGVNMFSKRDSVLVGIRTVLGTALELLARLQSIPNAFERRLAASYPEPVRPRAVAPDFTQQKTETMAEQVAQRLGVKARKPSNQLARAAKKNSEKLKELARNRKRVRLQPMSFEPEFMDEPAERTMTLEPQIAPLDISEGLARLATDARERSRIAEAAERARADQISRDRAAELRNIARAQEAAREAQNMAAAAQRAREAEARRNAEAAARARAAYEAYEQSRARATATEADRPPRAAHEVLGIASNASAEQIRAAFKRRSRQTHPDKPTGSAAAFREVSEAYERMIAAAPAPATRSRAAAEANTDFLRQAAAAARQAAMARESERQAAMQSEAARAADEFARMQAAGRAAAAARAQVFAMDEARLDAEARAAASRPRPNVVQRSSMRQAERRAADRAKAFADMASRDRARAAASKRR